MTTETVRSWVGRRAIGLEGKRLGTISNVFRDDDTGQETWLAVDAGLFGTRPRIVPAPGSAASDRGLQVAYTKKQVNKAPTIKSAKSAGRISKADEARLREHYGPGGTPAASERGHDAPVRSNPEADDKPSDLDKEALSAVLKRTVREFNEDDLVDRAAALTYYGVLSIFPALLALVSVLGLIGRRATQPLLDNLTKLAPGPARDILATAIQNLQKSQGAGGLLFVVGLATALWSASGYVGGFMRASNAIYEIGEGRPIWKTAPIRLGVTIAFGVVLVATLVTVVATGSLARQLGDVLGVGSTAVTVWGFVKWPVLLVVVSLMFAILYWAAPNVKQPGFRWITPGSVLAVVLWVTVSALFAFYVANFGSYNKTYGALGGVIIFLVWLWLTNIAILLGAELNAELERGRQIEAGMPADEEPFLEPRDTTKLADEPEAVRA